MFTIPRRCAIASLVLLGTTAAAFAQPAASPVAGDVDLNGSRVYIFVGKTGLGHNHAVVGRLQAGRVRLDAAEQAGLLVFDMRTFVADTADARKVVGLEGETDPGTQKQVTDNMLGPDVLDVARHPTAAFEIRSAVRSPRPAAGPNPLYDLTGVFTLHGVARNMVIPVEASVAGNQVVLRGSFPIRQTDFGMKPYKKLGGVVGVADELTIMGDIRVAAAPATPPGPQP